MKHRNPLLFCFPFAGGTADFYNRLESACEEKIDFVKLEYAGHGSRIKEPLCQSFEALTNDLLPHIKAELQASPCNDYALMGYSMGSIAVLDALVKILESPEELMPPKYVFISAHRPRNIDMPKAEDSKAVDLWVRERTIKIGGIDDRLINNSTFWRLYLPVFKTDYRMIADYKFPQNFTTHISATIFYSETDTPFEGMKHWQDYFVGTVEYHQYEGPHFFINQYYREMAKIIVKQMAGGIE